MLDVVRPGFFSGSNIEDVLIYSLYVHLQTLVHHSCMAMAPESLEDSKFRPQPLSRR